MRVSILYNPRAGRGKGSRVAQDLQAGSTRDGHEVRLLDVTNSGQGLAGAIEWSEAVAIVGGDGTLHHALPSLLEHPRPIYHAAMGTENLFAREFRHTPTPEGFAWALRRGSSRRIDVGRLELPGVEAVPFAIMASFGPDASIVHRLAAARDGPIRHVSYLKPSLAEFLSPRVSTVSIHVDGKALVERRTGMVLIANMRHYAVRLNPAGKADPGDGFLDVVFLPGASLLSVAAALVAWRAGVGSGAVSARGTRVVVEFEPGTFWPPQADGEAVGEPLKAGHQDLGSCTKKTQVFAQVIPNALSVFEV